MPFFRDSKDPVVGAADAASIAPSQADTLVDDGDTQRFTATGRPMPPYKPSAWANMSGSFVAAAPQHLPYRFTDDSLIPVPVIMEAPPAQDARPRKSSIMNKLKGLGSGKDNRPMKVVRMPRRDYLKYFARDEHHNYIGTEPERTWTPQEVEEKWGEYQNLPPTQWEVNVPSGLH